MDRKIVDLSISCFLKAMHERLEQAASLGKASLSCAEDGSIEKAVEISLDVETLTYEANCLLNAASLIKRLGSA